MSEQTSGALRAWFKRVEPLYPELFNTAHAICGNYDLAESALGSALMEVYLQNADGGMGFRERLKSVVRSEALRASREGSASEFTWPGFGDNGEDPVAALICREPPETQRLLMLRHGIGLSISRISQLAGQSSGRVREQLHRFELRCRRSLPIQERSHVDRRIARVARRQMASKRGIPHPSGIYRAFEAEASNQQVSEHRVAQVLYKILIVAMALVCAVLFWLFAVLVQPANLQTGSPAATAAPPQVQETPPPAEPMATMQTTITTEAPA